MELKAINTEALKTKLHKTKRFMQILTWCGIISVGFLFYGLIMKVDGIDSSFSMLPIAFASVVLILIKSIKD